MFVVVWRITERCNLSCGFCAYSRTLERSRREADPAEVLRFGRVLAAFQEATGQRVLVSWLGGEPLLWPALAELSATFSDTLGLALSTTTNGTALASPRVREMLATHFAELTVSIDGLTDFHDRVRGWPGGFASLRESVRALEGPALRRANTVLMRDNIADYPALCRELATWGFRELTFNQLGGNDRPEFHAIHRLHAEQVRALWAALPALRNELAARGVTLRGSPAYLRRIEATTSGARLPVEDCQPGARFLFIDEMGRAAPCSFTAAGYSVPISELRTVADLRNLPQRFATMRSAQRLAPCLDCHSTQVCEKFHA